MAINHIGFIMDGNGRWATAHSLARSDGYKHGFAALLKVLEGCKRQGINVVSVFAFSTENNSRPDEEKSAILEVVERFNYHYDGDMKITYMGYADEINDEIFASVRYIEEKTENNKGLHLNIALNYGARDDIVRAAKLACDHGDFSVNDFGKYLSSSTLPPLDAIVRTGGEKRLSNFMLFEAAYSELFFLDKLWPDMTAEDVDLIVEEFSLRNRKFGK